MGSWKPNNDRLEPEKNVAGFVVRTGRTLAKYSPPGMVLAGANALRKDSTGIVKDGGRTIQSLVQIRQQRSGFAKLHPVSDKQLREGMKEMLSRPRQESSDGDDDDWLHFPR